MKLSELIRGFGGELLDTAQSDHALSILLRVSGPDLPLWQGAVEMLLEANAPDGIEVDISRVYRRQFGETVYFWRIVIVGDSKSGLQFLLRERRKFTPRQSGAVKELTSFPLVGRGAPANTPTKGIAGVYTARAFSEIVTKHGLDR